MKSAQRPLYLDHNATTPLKPGARLAMAEAFEDFGNPSSVHAPGRAARQRVEAAREILAQRIGVKPAEIVFTSGGTEANSAAFHGFPAASRLVSAIEHDSLKSATAESIAVTPDGSVDCAALDALLTRLATPALVAVMLVNNETGVIQPIAEVAQIVRRHGALLHVDAVQAFGKIPVDFANLGAHSMALSAHKIGGPKGIGALILREGLAFDPWLTGGGQERRRRAGTENVPGIAGFGAAVAALEEDLAAAAALAPARDAMEAAIAAASSRAQFPGKKAPRVGATSCIVMPGVPAETQLMHFDLQGLAVSSGSACSSGKVRPSHVLAAMGYGEADARSALRISGGLGTLPQDYARAAEVWIDLWRHKAAV